MNLPCRPSQIHYSEYIRTPVYWDWSQPWILGMSDVVCCGINFRIFPSCVDNKNWNLLIANVKQIINIRLSFPASMTFESAFTFIYRLCLWISSESTKWVASESGQTSFYICTSFCSVERENTTKIESARASYAHIYMPAQIQHLHSIKLWCWEFGFPNPVRSMFPEGSRLLPLLLQSLCTAALLKSNASSKIGLIIPCPASKHFLSNCFCMREAWDASSSESFYKPSPPPLTNAGTWDRETASEESCEVKTCRTAWFFLGK